LGQIDYSPRDKQKLRDWLHAPWGIIIVSGPTGSGKTTALYACIRELAKPEQKVMSIENPIEFFLPWVVQMEIRPAAGVTFPVALRSVLRSDPDVVMVGEIRDLETLTISQQCALTGHLVLTTMHADEAARTLRRMVEMGGEPFVVGDATKLVVAQRLVRKLCPQCSKEQQPPEDLLRQAEQLASHGGLDWGALRKEFRSPVGCPKCNNSGYRGRNVIAEALEVTHAIREAVKRGASVDELRTIAVGEGMRTMAAHGIQRAAEGYTAMEEVLRVLAVR
jgi:type II secretory ATPase GspE/PulE/Tfp pilus assembly ATPase PilB-like protein